MAQVANPYKKAIDSTWSKCSDDIDTVSDGLESAVRVFESGAWIGGLADQAHDLLLYLRGELKGVAMDADDAFSTAYDSQPPSVEEDAWQIHWRNLGPK